MQGDEHRAVLRVGEGRAVVEGRIFISGARLQDLKALCLESSANLKG